MKSWLSLLLAGILIGSACSSPSEAAAQSSLLEGMQHLRLGSTREWSSFPEKAELEQLELSFASEANKSAATVSIRQQDVRQKWQVILNDKVLGTLVTHEEDLIVDFEIPAGLLKPADNKLVIRPKSSKQIDDVRVGQITLHADSPDSYRNQSKLLIDITDPQQRLIPGRITIVDQAGTLVPVAIGEQAHLAARQGVVYTSTGKASIGVAAGRYRIFAGRGFEYEIATAEVGLGDGEQAKRTMVVERSVNTRGWVACDTHVHTVTHSGHGDCSIEERMITLAGEGIELPIATDHNKQIDYAPIAKQTDTLQFFTPVIGNEVTTSIGHFNVFPFRSGADVPNHKCADWPSLFDEIYRSQPNRIAILNHGTDIHGGFRPFSPRHHVQISGENRDTWQLKANAMEIINSGATQTDITELFRVWCGLVNSGLNVTPVGCSDSHDVARYIVGQGRTYIHVDDSDPAQIDVEKAVAAFLAGEVIVSYGCLADVTLNTTARPGQTTSIAPNQKSQTVQVTVRGPTWCEVDTASLFVGGVEYDSQKLSTESAAADAGVLAKCNFVIPTTELTHDTWLTVAVSGPGVKHPAWRMAKPYQADSIKFIERSFSCCGPIRIDANGDGRCDSQRAIARALIDKHAKDLSALSGALSKAHPTVAVQAAAILNQDGSYLTGGEFANLRKTLPAEHQKLLKDYQLQFRESEIARAESNE